MYADDVIYLLTYTMGEVLNELTKSMVHVSLWLKKCCLQLNIMLFTTSRIQNNTFHVFALSVL